MKRFWPLILTFLYYSAVFQFWGGGVNPASRMMTLSAMKEDRSFEVTPYVTGGREWSFDWSKTPDGRYFSNKAPGPMILSYPFYWLIDEAFTSGVADRKVRDQIRHQNLHGIATLLSWILQIIPLGFALFLSIRILRERGVTEQMQQAFLLMVLFASPVAFYHASFYGHSIAATFLLLSGIALVIRRPFWVSLFFGLSVLCDYGSAFAIPGLIASVLVMKMTRARDLSQLVLGALLPVFFFSSYHWLCFGGPFTLPMKFQNPIFVESASSAPRFWGVIGMVPDPIVVLELLFGDRRGLIKTAPWIFVVLVWAIANWKMIQRATREGKAVLVFSGLGLLGLLYMNASFNGWDGGAAPVARYMSPIFMLLAFGVSLASPLFSGRVEKWIHASVWVGMIFFTYYAGVKWIHDIENVSKWISAEPWVRSILGLGPMIVFMATRLRTRASRRG